MGALKLKEVEKIAKDEGNTLNKEIASIGLAEENLEDSQNDLDTIKKYVAEMKSISIQLEQSFSGLTNAFSVISSTAHRQSPEHAQKMAARLDYHLQKLVGIEERVDQLTDLEKLERKKMVSIERDLMRNVRKMRRIFKEIGRFTKKTKRRTNKLSKVTYELRHRMVTGGGKKTHSRSAEMGLRTAKINANR